MPRTHDCEKIVRTSNGSIDYEYYSQRARQLRAAAVIAFFRASTIRAIAR